MSIDFEALSFGLIVIVFFDSGRHSLFSSYLARLITYHIKHKLIRT